MPDTSFILLHFKHPFKGDCSMARWKINRLPGSILLDRIHLFLHCGVPYYMSLHLGKGVRLFLVEREMELCSKDIIHGSVSEGLAVVECVDAVLFMGERSDESSPGCARQEQMLLQKHSAELLKHSTE
jgi:hypothetical protein